jgi:elongator complex protein 3
LLETAELMDYHKKGLWKPYSHDELVFILKKVLLMTPRYCRLTRVIRDIPSTEIAAGDMKTNFRQIVEREMEKEGLESKDIRAREIRGEQIDSEKLTLKITRYDTSVSKEIFMEFVTKEDKIAGFMRLSLPSKENFIEELRESAIIREIHIYGQSIDIGQKKEGKAQHMGLGKRLIDEAVKITRRQKYKKLSVISSVGTREYYKNRGFSKDVLYQHKRI